MKFLAGWKTMLFAALVAIIPLISIQVNTFVASNTGWAGILVGGLFATLRLVTKSSVFKPIPK